MAKGKRASGDDALLAGMRALLEQAVAERVAAAGEAEEVIEARGFAKGWRAAMAEVRELSAAAPPVAADWGDAPEAAAERVQDVHGLPAGDAAAADGDGAGPDEGDDADADADADAEDADSEREWSAERDALLARLWPAADRVVQVVDAINDLPGAPVDWPTICARAEGVLGLAKRAAAQAAAAAAAKAAQKPAAQASAPVLQETAGLVRARELLGMGLHLNDVKSAVRLTAAELAALRAEAEVAAA